MKNESGYLLPLVSIIIPVYNGGEYLRQAIDSALAQTYTNIEVIVVNDGSNDAGETERTALSYGDRIRYIYKENGGVSSALNEGIRQMKGSYFSWLSHDDVYTKDKIKHQVECIMEAAPNTIALCAYRQIDKNSNFLPDIKRNREMEKDFSIAWHEALRLLWKQGFFNGCGFLIPKEAFEKCGGFNEDLRYCQDLLMWITLFLNGYNLVYRKQYDVYFRVHDRQLTQIGRQLYHRDSKEIANIVVPQLCSNCNTQYQLLFYYARSNAIYNNKTVVEACIAAADKSNLLSVWQKIRLHMILVYGSCRPVVRKLYYAVFKKVKTQ